MKIHPFNRGILRNITRNDAKNIVVFYYFFFGIFIAGFFLLTLTAHAQETVSPTKVYLKVAAFDQILYDDNFSALPCPDSQNSTTTTINAWCPVSQLAAQQNWSASSTWYAWGVMLKSINQYDGADGNYWLWFDDNEPGVTALNQHLLRDGENLLLVYGTSPLKLVASTTAPWINSTTTVSAQYFDINAWQWQNATGSDFFINGQAAATSTDGQFDLWTSTTTPYEIYAKKTGYLNSAPITVSAQLPNININLRIETASSTLFNQTSTVWACENPAGSGVYSLNGACAVNQSGMGAKWSAWGQDLFLDSLGGFANNENSNGVYWLWFDNLEYGTTSLNHFLLASSTKFLLTYGIYPLKIFASSTPLLDATTTVELRQFGFDASWNAVWQPAASSTISVNGRDYFSPDGRLDFLISTSSPYVVSGKKTGFLDSEIFILTPEQISSSTGATSTQSNNTGGFSSGGSAPIAGVRIDVQKAINFLLANQAADGSVASSALYSDWAALALAGSGQLAAIDKLKNYLISAALGTALGSVASDSERRAMALMALGANPCNATGENLIANITRAFDGQQIGDASLVNDDIFAIFPLIKSGYSGADQIISQTIGFILSKQIADGSWGSIDLTAAAVQALALAGQNNLPPDLLSQTGASLAKAKNFLKNLEQSDGSFNHDIFSTAWAAQAILALGDSISSWQVGGQSPLDFLALKQQADGGFGDMSQPLSTRIWATAYALLPAQNKTWADILVGFARPTQNIGGTGPDNISSSSTATSTATTTPIIATSTPILKPPTVIATSTGQKEALIENKISASPIAPISMMPQLTIKAPVPKKTRTGIPAAVVPAPQISASSPPAIQTSALAGALGAAIFPSNSNHLIQILFYFAMGAAILLGLYLIYRLFKH